MAVTLKPFRDVAEKDMQTAFYPNCHNIETSKVPLFKKGEKHEKKWGYELWIHNTHNYCGKILHFNRGAKFSMHFHIKKVETWYIQSGAFILKYIDPTNAKEVTKELIAGDVIDMPRGCPHQLFCVAEGDVFEVSTQHFEYDSYRVAPGDSQT